VQERERIGVGLVLITAAALPVLFFLAVVQSLVLAGAALLVELGLFTAVLVALRRPQHAGATGRGLRRRR
jgi:hypothetical protein